MWADPFGVYVDSCMASNNPGFIHDEATWERSEQFITARLVALLKEGTTVPRLNSLFHASTHCSTSQFTVPRLNSLFHVSFHCSTSQLTVPRLISLFHVSIHCSTSPLTVHDTVARLTHVSEIGSYNPIL